MAVPAEVSEFFGDWEKRREIRGATNRHFAP
jgi:hypothetical protein